MLIVNTTEGIRKSDHAQAKTSYNKFKDWYCGAGLEFLWISNLGDVFGNVCRHSGKYGNVFTGFELPTEPMKCPADSCYCAADLNILKSKERKHFKSIKHLADFSAPRYNKENILSTLSIIVNYFYIDELPTNLFLNFKISQSRGTIIRYKNGKKNLTIIDESYNSNPLSFKFALDRFDKNYKDSKKKFILIGNMLELGKFSKKLHIKIAKYINKSKINKTHVYGNYTKHTFNKLKPQMRGKILNNKLEILNLIKKQLPNNSFLMIKGSNSTGLNKIIKNL